MVDLAIASNFARALTEEQFPEGRKTQRRRPAAETAIRPAAQAEAPVQDAAQAEAPVQDAAGTRPTRAARSPLARLVSRLVQVRG
jgi:hypothetical protein